MVHALEIGTNFDPALPGELGRLNERQPRGRVLRVYGGLPADPVGGGRPGHRLPDVDLEGLSAHIAALDAVGIGFSYTLNAPDLFGSQNDPAWWHGLDRFLAALSDAGVRRITAANHDLLRHLRDQHTFALSRSLIDGPSTVQETLAAVALGADHVTLNGHRVNRDLGRIRAIRAATDVSLGLNVNLTCRQDCATALDHYRSLGFLSRRDKAGDQPGWIRTEPRLLECTLELLEDPTGFVRSSFVPPAYLDLYAEAGVDLFKFSDRTSDTPRLLRTLSAYVDEADELDLFDFVHKRGAKLLAALEGPLPRRRLADLPAPRITIDGLGFVRERFIERQPELSPEAERELASSLVTVHDPAYLARFAALVRAVKDKVAGRPVIPGSEQAEFEALFEALDPRERGER